MCIKNNNKLDDINVKLCYIKECVGGGGGTWLEGPKKKSLSLDCAAFFLNTSHENFGACYSFRNMCISHL